MKMYGMPNKAELNATFEYKDGVLINKVKRGNRALKGAISGYRHKVSGYHRIKIGKELHRRARVIWVMHFGDIEPGLIVDHINRVKDDDRLSNLRLVTYSENSMNQECKGYCRTSQGKYRVRIMTKGVNIHIGHFNTEAEARLAYLEAKLDAHVIRGVL